MFERKRLIPMGQMRFVIPRPERLMPGAADHAYLASGDGIPWECHVTQSNDEITIERDTRESGYFYFPWKVAGRGLTQIYSGCLMERPKPYSLPLELARGTLNRVRNQASLWQSAGMTISTAFDDALKTAMLSMSRAATGQDDPGASQDHAEEAIRLGLDAADMLTQDYAQQVMTIRRGQPTPPSVLLGARLSSPPRGDAAARFLAAFNTAVIGVPWAEIEPSQGGFQWDATDKLVAWAQENSVRVCLGPLLKMDKHSLPDWLFLDDGYEEVQASVVKFIDAVVNRYRGKVQLWHVTARMNQDGAFAFSEEQRLRLVVDAVDRVKSVDARTPLVVSFNQPWAEYIARKDQELTPINFADTLIRGELGLAGIGMEIHYGYWPGGTMPRDAMDTSRLLDRWSQIGVPLMVFLSAPSSMGADALARHPAHPLVDLRSGGVNAAWQQQVVERLFPVFLAKPPVQAIIWDHWTDAQPHELSCAGLLDGSSQSKPALAAFTNLRRQLLGQ